MTVFSPTSVEEALVVHRFPLQKGEVRAYFQQYGDAMWAHVRRFERAGGDGDYRPTKKGIALRLDDLNDLLVAVAALVANKGEVADAKPEELPL